MTQKEDKDLLYIVLCAMLPYDVIVETQITNAVRPKYPILRVLKSYMLSDFYQSIENVIHKPYLRQMESMTEEEEKEYYETMYKYTHRIYPNSCDFSEHTEYSWTAETFDWLNKYHFDYRGLIPKGLALPAPDGMYSN